ncbi:hypothetical protein Trydic_g6445 [Trypoxylus dichotomus]
MLATDMYYQIRIVGNIPFWDWVQILCGYVVEATNYAVEFQYSCYCIILNHRKTRPPKKNLNIEELKALIEFKRGENTIILPADKGNATVVLSTRDFKDKMQELLDDPMYKPIIPDLTTYLEKTTKTKINDTPLSDEGKKSIIPREKSSVSKNVRVAEDT